MTNEMKHTKQTDTHAPVSTRDYSSTRPQTPSFWKGVFGGIVGSVVVIVLTVFTVFGGASHLTTAFTQEDTTSQTAPLTDFENTIISAVDQTKDGVVSVGNMQSVAMQGTNPFEAMYGAQHGIELPGAEEDNLQMVSQGSGVIYKIDGDTAYIVTNHHVVDGAQALEIRLTDGTTVEGTLVGSDELSDLAVIKMDAANVTTTVEFADSDKLQVGSQAIAIGSPLSSDFATSVTQGIVSGLNRSVAVDLDGDQVEDWNMTLLQTDAAINPGNSGGALINSAGQLIGINSSKFAATGVEGMGFAIPANDVQDIANQLETNGEVTRPVLGVSTYDVSVLTENSRVNILKLDPEMMDGVAVVEIAPNSAAAKADIQEYDVITAINGEAIANNTELRQQLYRYKIGDQIEVTVLRNGEETTITAELTEVAETTELEIIGE
ncbi:S1C family serine protease [Fundicoccus sp. Sow4_D5]|uniref:S1C family serine protease n=1 Tax=unclassified Fundicoccus TaxID=2761543 RepID=UPI003F917CA2